MAEETITQKTCTKCGESKPHAEYSRDSHLKSGLHPKCKACVKIYQQSISDRMRATARQRKEENPDRFFALRSAWRDRRREYVNAKARAHREANREAYREVKRRYKHNNRDKVRERQAQTKRNRRAKMRGCEGTFTAREWAAIKSFYSVTCLACGKREPEIKLHADHIVPISKGGRNAADNIQPLCASCNSKKGVRTVDYRPAFEAAQGRASPAGMA